MKTYKRKKRDIREKERGMKANKKERRSKTEMLLLQEV
jgi:hypothetical protein